MMMTPSKTGARRDAAKTATSREWIAPMHKIEPATILVNDETTKSAAWRDRVANMIVGRPRTTVR